MYFEDLWFFQCIKFNPKQLDKLSLYGENREQKIVICTLVNWNESYFMHFVIVCCSKLYPNNTSYFGRIIQDESFFMHFQRKSAKLHKCSEKIQKTEHDQIIKMKRLKIIDCTIST